ncbi:hypothetical protein E2C01_094417 [Portunus trituberculatus]|uniref:Uncharacterized protein n=1 Tax=Portunus trituberculatus TaxID=210409 RepID=A0A5B7JX42_PORTR|nr:hypothetical protein [Portunus trituberculatus]
MTWAQTPPRTAAAAMSLTRAPPRRPPWIARLSPGRRLPSCPARLAPAGADPAAPHPPATSTRRSAPMWPAPLRPCPTPPPSSPHPLPAAAVAKCQKTGRVADAMKRTAAASRAASAARTPDCAATTCPPALVTWPVPTHAAPRETAAAAGHERVCVAARDVRRVT